MSGSTGVIHEGVGRWAIRGQDQADVGNARVVGVDTAEWNRKEYADGADRADGADGSFSPWDDCRASFPLFNST